MRGYIIVNKRNNMFVESIAVTTNKLSERCIHSDSKISDFYSDRKGYKVIYLDENEDYFTELIDDMLEDKDKYMEKYNEIIVTLNEFSKYYK